MGHKTPTEQAKDQVHDEMRVRRATLADGRYFIFYELLRSELLDVSKTPEGEPRSLTELKEAGV